MMTPQGPQRTTFYITEDSKYMIAGDLMPFGAKPFASMRETLAKGANGPARGPADSPVTIVEFSDLQCPRCKEAQPTIEKLLTDKPNVHFIFQNFPLPSHSWSAKAAAYADCVGQASNDAFWKFVHSTYEAQAEITDANVEEKLTALADSSGVKGADMATCAAKPETTDRVQKSVAFGRSIDVTGTPMLFMNGRRMTNFANLPYEGLKRMVDFYSKPENQ
jgi:protein-disulfide isomerase